MINIIILIFTFIILVSQNILLLNEESLILLCFITFIFLGIKNLTASISSFFQEETYQIEKSLKASLQQILILSQKFITLKTSSNDILQKFITLKNYYFILIKLTANFIPSYQINLISSAYQKRLNFISKVENQTIKLLINILLQRLFKIIKLKTFYKFTIKSSKFLCIDKIILREYIHLIQTKDIKVN